MTDTKLQSILSEYSHCSQSKLYKILNYIISRPQLYDVNRLNFDFSNMQLSTTRKSLSYTNMDEIKVCYNFSTSDKNIYDILRDLFILVSKMISNDTLYKLEDDQVFLIDDNDYMYIEDVLCGVCSMGTDSPDVSTVGYPEIYGNKFDEDVELQNQLSKQAIKTSQLYKIEIIMNMWNEKVFI